MSEEPDRMDLQEFRTSRRRKTDNLLKEDHRDLKRFFALDSAAYRDLTSDGGLDTKTKELLGLVASTVLRCNDCIAYHCDQCVQVGWKKAELLDALNVALVVGGSITIPHIRTVWEVVEQLYEEQDANKRGPAVAAALDQAAKHVQDKVHEKRSEAVLTAGQKPRAGKALVAPAKAVHPAAPAKSASPTAAPSSKRSVPAATKAKPRKAK